MRVKKFTFIFILILISLLGVYFCAFRYPNLIVEDDATLYWTFLSLHWLASIPCYVIVGVFSYLSFLFVRDKMFCIKSVKLIKACSIIMCCDTCFFLALFITTLSLSLLTEIFTHIAVIVFGILMTILLYLFANHVEKVAQDQEDLEGTV